MRRALSVAVTVATLLLVGSCGSTASGGSQGFSGRILDRYEAPNGDDVTVFCRGTDLMVHMDGNKSGSIQMIPKEPRCA
jgi:hypothetical protein